MAAAPFVSDDANFDQFSAGFDPRLVSIRPAFGPHSTLVPLFDPQLTVELKGRIEASPDRVFDQYLTSI